MKQNMNKQTAAILSILIFCIAIMLSGNVFAGKTPPIDMATQSELDAAISELRNILQPVRTVGQILYTPQGIRDGVVIYVDDTGRHGIIAQRQVITGGSYDDQIVSWPDAINSVRELSNKPPQAGHEWTMATEYEFRIMLLLDIETGILDGLHTVWLGRPHPDPTLGYILFLSTIEPVLTHALQTDGHGWVAVRRF